MPVVRIVRIPPDAPVVRIVGAWRRGGSGCTGYPDGVGCTDCNDYNGYPARDTGPTLRRASDFLTSTCGRIRIHLTPWHGGTYVTDLRGVPEPAPLGGGGFLSTYRWA